MFDNLIKFEEVPGSKEKGMITLGDDFANKIGFTEGLFHGYLWRPEVKENENKHIIISLITSKFPRQGNTWNLFKTIESLGYSILVPNPSNAMRALCTKYGFEPNKGINPEFGAEDILWYETTTNV